MKTPVVLIIFNRPDHTETVLSHIAGVKPPTLLVIADGPRPNHPQDIQNCKAARAVIDRVDWKCEVVKNYSDVNLGSGVRPATGISWAFDQVETAIILEDDIVPHPTFFRYCEELLERFHDDQRVMVISGMKSQFGEQGTLYNAYSYGFRRALSCWGWATWRRAWRHYDYRIPLWPKLRESNWLLDITRNPTAVEYYKRKFDQAFHENDKITFWDYQWLFTCWTQNGHAIIPNVNLTRNIGVGDQSTHTKSLPASATAALEEMGFPLKHPPFVVRDFDADLHRYQIRHEQNKWRRPIRSYPKAIWRRLKRVLG